MPEESVPNVLNLRPGNGMTWGHVLRLSLAWDTCVDLVDPLHINVLLVQWNDCSVSYLSWWESKSVLYKRKQSKTKQNTLKTLEKKVLYSTMMSFIYLYGKNLPKSVSICAWRGSGWGRRWLKSASGSLTWFKTMLWICPILFHLAVTTHLLG